MLAERLTILRVAVSGPVPGLFDYLPPNIAGAGPPRPGMRVLAPFGRGTRVGMIVELTNHSEQPEGRLKPIESVLDPDSLLTMPDIALALWAAAYYQHPPGEVLFSALPARLRRPEALLDDGEPGWRLTAAGRADPIMQLG
ncbi:MAG: primosomal protein N', partial [Chromatiaceae bacterium]